MSKSAENQKPQPEQKRRGQTEAKAISGAIGTIATVVGMLLALGVIHPFGKAPDANAAVNGAAVKTIDRGTSRIDLTMIGPVPSGGQGTLFKGEGVFDYRLNRGEVTYDYSQLAAATNGRFPTTVEAIVDDNVAYVKLEHPEAGKRWLAVDLAKAYKQAFGIDIGAMYAYNSSPAGALTQLKATGDVKRSDTEKLRDGTSVTRYDGTLDLREIPKTAPEDQRADLRRAVDALIERGASPEVRFTAWVGDDDLVHKIDVEGHTSANRSSTTLRMELYDFGVKVNAAPPPTDEVASLPGSTAAAG